ncbi:MAG: hypothetical protein DMD35_06965 [Gemmatimonadetes bacterium]|nr:MAG: hypothetical protein DMD35_06965 [Gemmatimonadota bacterium]
MRQTAVESTTALRPDVSPAPGAAVEGDRRRTFLRSAAPVLLLAVAYYAGAQIGKALKSPDVPQSILWLPNSIVLGVLLVMPVRRWPAYLLAALPAQLLIAIQTGAPITPMTLLFVTNCADAALGAVLVRQWMDGAVDLVTLRAMLVFIGFAAFLSPILLSFADAAITVLTGFGDDYWASFVTRVRSDMLTHLVVVPPLAATLLRPKAFWRAQSWRRYAEGTVVLVLLVLVSNELFARVLQPTARGFSTPVAPFILPFLFWLTLRFGPGMTGLGLLAVAVVASWRVLYAAPYPLDAALYEQSIRGVQLFLTAMAIPLLCLAAVIRERASATEALRRSYDRIGELIGRVSAAQEAEQTQDLMLAEEKRHVAHLGRLAATGELAAALSHELRQPLTAIRSNAQAGIRLLAADPPPMDEIGEILTDIVADDTRAASVIDRIRTLLRNEPLTMDSVDLNEVCRSVEHVARANATINDARLELLLDPARPIVLGDLVQLQQVLLNLVLNAFEATASTCEDRFVSVQTRRMGDVATLTVRDSGVGFDSHVATHLFEPFFTTKAGGLGMGLTIAQSIVKRHLGNIRAEVGPNGGAVFVVTLPVSESAEMMAPANGTSGAS